MTDAINAGMASDRLLLIAAAGRPGGRRRLRRPARQPAPGPAEAALAVGPDLELVAADTDASAVTVALPPDVEAGARAPARLAAAVRQALGGRLVSRGDRRRIPPPPPTATWYPAA